MSREPQKCAKCPTPIVWALSAKTVRAMPIDAAPAPNGNIRLREFGEGWIADVLNSEKANEARSKGESLHLSHFATCPFSRDFRKPKAGRR